MCDASIIIDDILLFSNNIPTILHYLSFVAQLFIKYSLFFKLSKYEFFKPRVYYVAMISLLMETIPSLLDFLCFNTDPFHSIVFIFYYLVGCVTFTIDIARFKPILNR